MGDLENSTYHFQVKKAVSECAGRKGRDLWSFLTEEVNEECPSCGDVLQRWERWNGSGTCHLCYLGFHPDEAARFEVEDSFISVPIPKE